MSAAGTGPTAATRPYRHEGPDGYDTIEWAAAQPWSNGVVGTFGLSYPGAVQWLAAVEHPPSLKAMVPAMTYATPESFWYSGGVWDGSWLDWTWWNIAPDLRRRLDRSGPRTDEEVAAEWKGDGGRARRHRPMLTLPDFQGVAPWYYEWMRHPPRDTWWDWARLEGRYGRVDAAVLNLSRVVRRALRTGGSGHQLPGPARHTPHRFQPHAAHPRAVDTRCGRGRAFQGWRPWVRGPDAGIDYTTTVLRWMDHYLKGVARAGDDEAPVRVFVMGANRWRDASAWPKPGTLPDTLYLDPSGSDSVSGALASRRPAGDEASVIRSDPEHPLADPANGDYGAHDGRALVNRAEVAVFETASFGEPYEMIGQVVTEVAASATVPDFDLWVQFYDVAPDGTAWNLASPGTALQRASYRDGGPDRRLVRTGEIVRLRLEGPMTANRFLPVTGCAWCCPVRSTRCSR